MVEKAYEDLGEVPVDAADSANVPVDIWLQAETQGDEDKRTGRWVLTADNYMPRKGCLSGEGAYRAVSSDRDVLVRIVEEKWLPLYKTAVAVLSKFDVPDDKEGTSGLYYWSK